MSAPLHRAILDWYQVSARDLPWRRPDATPWGIFVSEVMLQQTSVDRVLPVWRAWTLRWPTPTALAADRPAEAIRAWGRLGYPRRALRLHQASVAMVQRHGGAVPSAEADLRALPGVGRYTAAAVASFAFRTRTAVVDTNVRRVQARLVSGRAQAAPALSSAELRLAADLLPADADTACRWNVAVMELGALCCTARSPRCASCPVADRCAWLGAGSPAYSGPVRRPQRWEGTDRQVRGALLRVLREAPADEVSDADLAAAWPHDEARRRRCLDSLETDGLVASVPGGRYRLPAG